MRKITTILVAVAISQTAANATNSKCPGNSVSESDLVRGELILNENDIIKIKISDQPKFHVEAKGRTYFSPPRALSSRYKLVEQPGWKWIAALSLGLYGNNESDSQSYFINHATITASYYPVTHKVVISHISPNWPIVSASRYWIFARVPRDAKFVVFDCGSFK